MAKEKGPIEHLGVAVARGIILLMSALPFMLCWDLSVAEITTLPKITYIQSVAALYCVSEIGDMWRLTKKVDQ